MAGKKRKTKSGSTPSSKGSGTTNNSSAADVTAAVAPSNQETEANPSSSSLTHWTPSSSLSLSSSPIGTLIQELYKYAVNADDDDLCHATLQALADGTSSVLALGSNSTMMTTAAGAAASTAAATTATTTTTTTTTTTASITAEAALGTAGKKKKRARSTTSSSSTSSPRKTTKNMSGNSSNNASPSSSNNQDKGGYLILLATHVINRLLAWETTEHKDRISKAQVLSMIAFLLARVLLPSSPNNNNNSTTTTTTNNNNISKKEDRVLLKLLERACANHGRSLLGRAILSITVACTFALEQLTGGWTNPPQQLPPTTTTPTTAAQQHSSIHFWIPATLALDSVVRFSHHCPRTQQQQQAISSRTSSSANETSYPVQFWNCTQALLEQKAMSMFTSNTFDDGSTSHLDDLCQYVSQSLGDMMHWEEPCLVALLGHGSRGGTSTTDTTTTTAAAAVAAATAVSAPPPAKKKATAANRPTTRRQTSRDAAAAAAAAYPKSITSSSSSPPPPPSLSASTTARIQSSFLALINDAPQSKWNRVKMDGRIAAKRWASMAFVWLVQGQKRILQATLGMLTNRSTWQIQVWNHDSDNDNNNNNNEEEAAKKRKSEPSTQPQQQPQHVELPANVALVALVSRLVGIVSDSHVQSGSRTPTGGLEAYVKDIMKISFNDAADSSSSSSSSNEPVTQTKKASAASSSSSKSKLQKHAPGEDVRNMTVLVLYHLLQAHEDCLEENYKDTHKSIVNDDDEDNKKHPTDATEKIQYKYSPVIHRLVEVLSRVAASTATPSSVTNPALSLITDQTTGTDRLQKVAAMFVLRNMCDGFTSTSATTTADDDKRRQQRPLDAQLMQFALALLSDCLETVDKNRAAQVEVVDNDGDDDVMQHYLLEEPLPVPQLSAIQSATTATTGTAARRRSSKSASSSKPVAVALPSSQESSYMGVLHSDEQNVKGTSEDFVLSLFLRSLSIVDEKKEPTTKKTTKTKSKKKQTTQHQAKVVGGQPLCVTNLYAFLFDTLQRCYTPESNDNSEMGNTKKGHKKRERSSTVTSVRKRRRTDESGDAELMDSVEQADCNQMMMSFFTPARSMLAESATTVLRKSISVAFVKESRRDKKSIVDKLRRSIRNGMSVEHILNVVELSQKLEDIMIIPKAAKATEKGKKKSQEEHKVEDMGVLFSPTFAAHERNLWLSHLNLCAVIGRGYVAKAENETNVLGDGQKILGDNTEKITVFQAISKTQCSDGQWPLWLNPALRVLVMSNVTSEADVSDATEDTAPECFVVDGVIASLQENFQSLRASQKLRSTVDEAVPLADYGFPLSLQDARLFLVACSRLSSYDRSRMLAKLLRCVQAGLFDIKQDGTRLSIILKDKEICGFIARVITLCSNFTIWATYPELWKHLNDFVREHLPLEMPPFFNESEWYRSEKCYMGMFSEWQAALPPIENKKSANTATGASPEVVKELTSILKLAFHMGFLAANSDRGHLLFSAWNANGNMPLWERRRSNDSPKEASMDHLLSQQSFDGKQDIDLADAFLQIRDEVCKLYVETRSISGLSSSALPFLLELAEGRGGNNPSPSQVKKKLKAAVSAGETYVSSLLERNEGAVAFFSTLEALAVYIAFAVASHTKPGDDIYATFSARASHHGSRSRGYSTESEKGPSDLDSVDSDGTGEGDAATKLREKLHSACMGFGAAPTHPDWLDASCRLLPSVTPSEALDIGRTAVRTLSKLLATSYSRHRKALKEALSQIMEQQNAHDDSRVVLAMKIIVLLSRYESESYPSSYFRDVDGSSIHNDPQKYLASICDVNVTVLDNFLKQCSPEHFREARDTWCPNAAQRILGRSHATNTERWFTGSLDGSLSTAELRVDGQWEVLLGTALAASCRAGPAPASEILSPEVYDSLVRAESWRGVCETAISCLMPAAALLRFGLARGGRQSHPLSLKQEGPTAEPVSKFQHFQLAERLPTSVSTSKILRDTIAETLSVLGRYCAQCGGDSLSSTTCHAIGTNILIDGKSFEDIRGLETCRFALTLLSELHSMPLGMWKSLKAYPFFIKQLARIIEFWARGAESSENSSNVSSNRTFVERLLVVLGLSSTHKVDTIAENGVNLSGMLALVDSHRLSENDIRSPDERTWRWGARQMKPLIGMVSVLCSEAGQIDHETRACIAMVLRRLAHSEYESLNGNSSNRTFVIETLVQAFNALSTSKFKDFVTICAQSSDWDDRGLLQKEVFPLLALLLSGHSGQTTFAKIEETVTALIAACDGWLPRKTTSRVFILDILLFYGCRAGRLHEIGSVLLNIIQSSEMCGGRTGNGIDLEPLIRYFRFVEGLRLSISRKEKRDPPAHVSCEADNGHSSELLAIGQSQSGKSDPLFKRSPPRSCSYALKSGFHGQHWYNCYTCGLTWDKGCCTLCALVCHEGHDVSYSRYSSFFCDCGAEDGGEGDRSRVSCKCLSSLPKEKIQELFEKEGWILPQRGAKNARDATNCSPVEFLSKFWAISGSFYIDIARTSFSKQVRQSLDELATEARRSGWFESLFEIMRKCFEDWAMPSHDTKFLQDTLAIDFEPEECDRNEFLRQSLQKRMGKPTDIVLLSSNAIVPMRAAKSNSFQVKFSGSTAERLKRSKNEISRSAIVADSRGRLVIAEPCSLLFCSAAPCVNMRHVASMADIPLSRSSVCILGSSCVKFNVIGMQLCSCNDRHLLVWGASEACVIVLKDSHDGIDLTVSLSLDLDPAECETDYVVKCEWVPGSQTCVAVGCGRFVSIFDVSRTDNESRSLPVVSFSLGFDSNLRDIEVAPAYGLKQSMKSVPDSKPDKAAILFMMLESGRLYSVDLEYDTDGKPSARVDQQFETDESISLPLSGVRSYQGSSIGSAGTHQKTLGDGSCLTYLNQSNLLLYKSTSSCVLALTLGITGKIIGSFELLPHTISSEILGTSPNGYSIGGPYTHWTELGITKCDDGLRYFRVACVGRSWRTNQPKLLCLEFNEINVKVKEIAWESDSIGLGLSLYSSFEGLCGFSLPYRIEDAARPDSMDGSRFAERGFLCAVTSNGCLLFYGEEEGFCMAESAELTEAGNEENKSLMNPKSDLKLTPDRSVLASHPLTLFERLKNVSDDLEDDLLYGGDGLGGDSKELKRKLSRDNSVFLMSPRREGCTLTVSLKSSQANHSHDEANNDLLKKRGPRELAIAAVRVLVGSTSSECIPKKLFVQGRPIDLKADMKKWYSITLTDEEIALTVRTGVLAIGMSPAHDASSSPLIDAMEVYAIDRLEVDPWIPRKLSTDTLGMMEPGGSNKDISSPKSLILSSHCVEILCDILGPTRSLLKSESDLLKHMVQETAVTGSKIVSECLENLLARLYPNLQARNSIKDEGTLQGCSLLLSRCQNLLESNKATVSDSTVSADFDSAWFTVRALLRSCLRSSAYIARCRPVNYLRASDVIAENKISSGSIAVDSSKLISEGIRRSLPCEDLCELFVELSLAESAIAANTDIDQGERLASFLIVRSLLESDNLAVVERSCHAISSFCRKYGPTEQSRSNRTNDLFAALQAARIVCYQCDNCGKVPITGVRYTLLEEDHDIDLCKNCFRLGSDFADSKSDDSEKVVINGKTLDLTCGLIKTMHPVPVVKADVTEAMDIQPDPGTSAPLGEETEEREELRRALRLSLGKDTEDTSRASSKVDQSFEDFVDAIFSSVIDLLSNAFAEHRGGPWFGLMLSLLIDLVHHSNEAGGRLSRARRVANEICLGASHIIDASGKSSKDFQRFGRVTLIMSLRALTYLLVPEMMESDVGNSLLGKKDDGVEPGATTDADDVKCDVHGVLAVRRRCARGEHKDRRFYVCGMDRRQRCKFFLWADQVGQKSPSKSFEGKSNLDESIASCLWNLFSKRSVANTQPLHLQLCNFLETILSSWKSEGAARLILSTDTAGTGDGILKPSVYNGERATVDFSDGVLCSREKLHAVTTEDVLQIANGGTKPSIAAIAHSFYADGDTKLMEASLELLAFIANHETDGIDRWFSLLCEIIGSPNKSANLRALAKRVLKQLCGGKKDLYHSVRDHFVFGFQVTTLLHNTRNVLRTCVLLKEKSRQSGPFWKTGRMAKWDDLKAGGLIGSEVLLSEDCSSLQSEQMTGEILDELWNVAKTRGENWRRFCGLMNLPSFHDGNTVTADDGLLGDFKPPAPVVCLLWISSCVSGSNQIKALKLVDLALSNSKERKKLPTSSNESAVAEKNKTDTCTKIGSWLKAEVLPPENILLNGERKLDIGDMHAFMMHFAYKSKAAELRKVACSVATKILRNVSNPDIGSLVGHLLGQPLCEAGQLGKNSVELLNILQGLLRGAGKLPAEVTESSDLVLRYFKQQFQAIKHDRANREYFSFESSSGSSKKKFDLASCVHCHTDSALNALKESNTKSPSSRLIAPRSGGTLLRAAGTSCSSATANDSPTSPVSASAAKRDWLPEQVSPYTKGRLDSSKESATNTAFATFRQLKYRLALSEFHVSVNDPRGRFVKTITLYYTPRPVGNVHHLKSGAYENKWQRCATLNLARGASRTSCTLDVPVVAANLKIEFTDFYERPGGSKAPDGSLLVHCPRCTRVVSNAHGVCGNCGEVAFQCRKCRHINYDQLQSFLCVECGFCSSGSFSFDLVAGVASNAIAITNDEDYERSERMLNVAIRLHEDLREALREKLRWLIQSKKTKENHQNQNNSSSFLLTPGLRRAFQGQDSIAAAGAVGSDGTLNRVAKRGWAVKMIASPTPAGLRLTPGVSATSADRTRSLLQLARQIRNEGGSPEQRRNGDVIIRQLGGRGPSIEALDNESDLLTLLEGAGSGASIAGVGGAGLSGMGAAGILDSSDPLSRLLASFQTSRGRNRTDRTDPAASRLAASAGDTSGNTTESGASRVASALGTSAPSSTSNSKKLKETLEECEKLHALMREAEGECYELDRRVHAWKRLERDEMAARGSTLTTEQKLQTPPSFTPSHCSTCSGPVAVQLLVLWLRLFQADPLGVAVSQEFIELLFEENIHLSKSLIDLKRSVLREIATKAPTARSRLVLDELSKRLRYVRDVSSAEILGKIIEGGDEFSLLDDYVTLATDVLQHESML